MMTSLLKASSRPLGGTVPNSRKSGLFERTLLPFLPLGGRNRMQVYKCCA